MKLSTNENTETEKKKFDLPVVLTVSFSHLVADTYSAFLAPVLPLLISGLGITKFQAGLLDFARKIPSLLNPLFGMIADRLDAKYFLILGCIIITVSMSLLGAVNDFATLFILIFIAGLGTSIYHVPGPVIIKKVATEKLGLGLSFYMLGGEFARFLGPLVILSAISLWTFEGSWKIMPLGLAVAVFLYFKVRKISVHKKNENGNAKLKDYRKYLRFFVIITGIVIFRSGMHSALTLYLPTYMNFKGNSLWLSGISLSILQFAGAAGTFTIGILSDKFGRKKTLLLLSLINPLLMFAFIFSSGFFIFPVLALCGFILLGSNPIILALVQERDTENLSFLNGTYMTISFVGSSAMVLTVGLLSDIFGLDTTYIITAFLAIAVIPFVLMLKETKAA
ncbi:MAG: MFS transporter [Candidatus Delongbacteria bacterium]|jgi:FSR family fosmidomycin resistance protein-like MFS transporter|nr:MFS transporter [Candidatus Delongbacteria bacterium]